MPPAQNSLGASRRPMHFFACDRCGRRGHYRLATLIALFGREFPVAGLPLRVAEHRGCPHVGVLPLQAGTPCGAHFDLAAQQLFDRRLEEAAKSRR